MVGERSSRRRRHSATRLHTFLDASPEGLLSNTEASGDTSENETRCTSPQEPSTHQPYHDGKSESGDDDQSPGRYSPCSDIDCPGAKDQQGAAEPSGDNMNEMATSPHLSLSSSPLYSPCSSDTPPVSGAKGDCPRPPLDGGPGTIQTAIKGILVGVFEGEQNHCSGCQHQQTPKPQCHPNDRYNLYELIRQGATCSLPSCTEPGYKFCRKSKDSADRHLHLCGKLVCRQHSECAFHFTRNSQHHADGYANISVPEFSVSDEVANKTPWLYSSPCGGRLCTFHVTRNSHSNTLVSARKCARHSLEITDFQ